MYYCIMMGKYYIKTGVGLNVKKLNISTCVCFQTLCVAVRNNYHVDSHSHSHTVYLPILIGILLQDESRQRKCANMQR